MNNITKLIQHLQKQQIDPDATVPEPILTPDFNTLLSGGSPPTGQPVTQSAASMMGGGQPPSLGTYEPGSEIPAQNRLYLKDGKIPGTEKTPNDLKIPSYTGTRKGEFVDKRLLQKNHKDDYEAAHSPKSGKISYGGIVVNNEGQILMREAANMFGYEGAKHSWTLAKGGADEGETPEDAALREVLEETGIKASIMEGGEIPGHYSSANSSNKYFLMRVDDENAGVPDTETSAIKWVSPEKAIELLQENTEKDADGNVRKDDNGHDVLHTSSQRDIDAIAAAMSHHEELQGDRKPSDEEDFESMNLSKEMFDYSKLNDNIIGHFLEHGKWPDDFWDSDGPYEAFRQNIALQTQTLSELPEATDDAGVAAVREMLGKVMRGLNQKWGIEKPIYTTHAPDFETFSHEFLADWGGSGTSMEAPHAHLIQEALARRGGTPLNFLYRRPIPEDVDITGKPTVRTDSQRKEIVEKYNAFRNPSGPMHKQHLDNIKNTLGALLSDTDALVEGTPNLDILKMDLTEAQNLGVPKHKIKDLVREMIADHYGLTMTKGPDGTIAKIAELGLAGHVPIEKTPTFIEGQHEDASGDGAAKGTFSWGEPYDFEDGATASMLVEDSEGNYSQRTDVPAWELMYHRAQQAGWSISPTDTAGLRGQLVPSTYHKMVKAFGENFLRAKLTIEAKKDPANLFPDAPDKLLPDVRQGIENQVKAAKHSEIETSAREMIDEYLNHLKALTRMTLDATWPDTQVISIGRKTNSLTEIHGQAIKWDGIGSPIKGSKTLDTSGIRRGDPWDVETRRIAGQLGLEPGQTAKKPLHVYVHSAGIFGGSMNPKQWHGEIQILSDVHKDHVFITHAMDRLYNEDELIIENHPDNDSIVAFNKDTAGSDEWLSKDDTAGLSLDHHLGGLFSHPGLENWQDILEPATHEDNSMVISGGSQFAHQFGSNPGGLYKIKTGADKGKLYYVKHANVASHANEVLSNRLYEIAGINVPKTEFVRWGDSQAVLSEWLPGAKGFKASPSAPIPAGLKDNPDIQEGFLVDAMLANWDVIGLEWDNVVEHDGKIYRVDQGGTLDLRAQGDDKHNFFNWKNAHTGAEIEDLNSMTGGLLHLNIGVQASQAFADMSSGTMDKAAKKLYTLTNSKIKEVVEASGLETYQMPPMIETLQKRRDSIVGWLKVNHPTTFEALSSVDLKKAIDFLDLQKTTDSQLEQRKKKLHIWIPEVRRQEHTSSEEADGAKLNATVKQMRQDDFELFEKLTAEEI